MVSSLSSWSASLNPLIWTKNAVKSLGWAVDLAAAAREEMREPGLGEGKKPAELAFTPDKTGDFVGHCSVFCGSGHGSITLTLHVTE